MLTRGVLDFIFVDRGCKKQKEPRISTETPRIRTEVMKMSVKIRRSSAKIRGCFVVTTAAYENDVQYTTSEHG